jgi:serine/threonine protein kinase
MAKDLFEALSLFRSRRIIHGDLKPENLLPVNEESMRIKAIDFGAARSFSEQCPMYIQSRYYRAPEIVLRLPHGPAIDIWSLGCILCELFMGVPLFAGQNEIQLLEIIGGFLGPIPEEMRNASPRFAELFFEDGRMKTEREVCHELGIMPARRDHDLQTENGLHDLILQSAAGMGQPRAADQRRLFVDLLERLLKYVPDERITPEAALRHPFLVADLGA